MSVGIQTTFIKNLSINLKIPIIACESITQKIKKKLSRQQCLILNFSLQCKSGKRWKKNYGKKYCCHGEAHVERNVFNE